MNTYISILRGINVSGKRMIKMDALKNLYEDLGFKNVQTYIQSGNVVFHEKPTQSEILEKKISKKIMEKFSYEVPVIVLDNKYLRTVIKSNPFLKDKSKDTTFMHVTFLSGFKDPEHLSKMKDLKFNEDKFIIMDDVIYLYCPGGYGNTKLNNNFFENKLKVSATTRNWKTVNELINLVEKKDI